ncbi:ABC transporter substrate-binding protein [Desulfurivibrio sp. D14AmB]|uniref:ABC transporter substrate-binding protein n=1 Tax=Desulfurivibrio sp. D14AmB TaxID=3374370 RepID=UPI00376EB96B
MKRCLFLLLLLAAFFLPLAGCERKTAEPPLIRFGHAPHDHHAALYIAALNPDYFRDNGGVFLREQTFKTDYDLIADGRVIARLQIVPDEGGIRLIRRLAEKQVDLAYGGVPAMLVLIDQGSEVRILLPLMGEGAGFVVNRDLPADSWAAFVEYVQKSPVPVRIGYRIGVSVQNLAFEAALRSAGLSYSRRVDDDSQAQVVLLNLHGSDRLFAALESGLIDGFVINQPLVAKAEVQQVGRLLVNLRDLPPAGSWVGMPCCALAGDESFVRRHPREVAALLSLLKRANDHINEYPEASALQIAAWLEIDPEIERRSLPTIRYSNEFDHNWYRGVNHWLDTMIEGGELKGVVAAARRENRVDEVIYSSATRDLRRPTP